MHLQVQTLTSTWNCLTHAFVKRICTYILLEFEDNRLTHLLWPFCYLRLLFEGPGPDECSLHLWCLDLGIPQFWETDRIVLVICHSSLFHCLGFPKAPPTPSCTCASMLVKSGWPWRRPWSLWAWSYEPFVPSVLSVSRKGTIPGWTHRCQTYGSSSGVGMYVFTQRYAN